MAIEKVPLNAASSVACFKNEIWQKCFLREEYGAFRLRLCDVTHAVTTNVPPFVPRTLTNPQHETHTIRHKYGI